MTGTAAPTTGAEVSPLRIPSSPDAPCAKATVTVYAGETALGSIDILPSRNMEDFQLYTIPLKAYSGKADLRLVVSGMASLYRVQLG